MSRLERRLSPAYQQVEAYEETWKRDHDAVRECWAWEDTIAVGISTGSLLERVNHTWRERVFCGTEDFCDDANEFYRTLFTSWLGVTDEVLARAVELKGQFGRADGAEELRQIAERVRDHLKRWERPRLSMAVGLRAMTLTPEAAAELDRIVDQAKTTSPAMPTRRLETKGPDFLLK